MHQGVFFEIVEFIEQVLDKYPDKIQLHFALGLINEERLDPEIAKEEYTALISYEQQQPQLSLLFMEAKQRLHQLKA